MSCQVTGQDDGVAPGPLHAHPPVDRHHLHLRLRHDAGVLHVHQELVAGLDRLPHPGHDGVNDLVDIAGQALGADLVAGDG